MPMERTMIISKICKPKRQKKKEKEKRTGENTTGHKIGNSNVFWRMEI